MGKTNNATPAPEPTIFDDLGIIPPKNVKVRAAAEHVLTQTVKYARSNGSCSTGTADFLINTLSLAGVTADVLAGRINKLGSMVLTITFEVPTTGVMLRSSGKTIGTMLSDSNNSYAPVFTSLNRDEHGLNAYDRFVQAGAASLFGTYTDYVQDGGKLLSIVSSRPTVMAQAEKAIVNL